MKAYWIDNGYTVVEIEVEPCHIWNNKEMPDGWYHITGGIKRHGPVNFAEYDSQFYYLDEAAARQFAYDKLAERTASLEDQFRLSLKAMMEAAMALAKLKPDFRIKPL